jgi:hypothetical protein
MIPASASHGSHDANREEYHHRGCEPAAETRMTNRSNQRNDRPRSEGRAKGHCTDAECLNLHRYSRSYDIRLTR